MAKHFCGHPCIFRRAWERCGLLALLAYIEIPVEVAESFTGYRHDAETTGLAEGAFEVLHATRPASAQKSFLQRLFGK